MVSGSTSGGSNGNPSRNDELFFLLDEPLDADHAIDDGTRRIARNLVAKLDQVPALPNERPTSTPHKAQRSVRELLINNQIHLGPAQERAMARGAVTCAVFGEWGSGKTSFLRLLEREYRDKGSTTVWFEPWRYEREDHLLVPLMVEVSGKVAHRITNANVKQAALETGKRLVGRAAKAVLRTGGKMVEAQTGFDPAKVGETFIEQYGETSTDWTESLSEIEKFRQGLYDTIELAAGAAVEQHGAAGELQYPVAVFIDDLDRCEPEQVRRLLESIKLFLDAPGCVFFVALDEEQVQFALSEPYRQIFPQSDGINVRAHTYGRRYLEKFFQQRVHLSESYPPFHQGIRRLRWWLWLKLRRTLWPHARERRRELQWIFGSVRLNARALKRCARWLYGEQDLLETEDLMTRFAELVFSINYEKVWVSDLQHRTPEGRRAFFRAAAFCFLDDERNYDVEGVYSLTEFFRDASNMSAEKRREKLAAQVMLVDESPEFLETVTSLYNLDEESELRHLATLLYYAGDRYRIDEILASL
jgi:hypothetical protein